MGSKEACDAILENTKASKDAGKSYQQIYVHGDLHPAISANWKQSGDVVTEEKAKSVDDGCTIMLSYNPSYKRWYHYQEPQDGANSHI